MREAHSEREGKFPTKQARLFFGEFYLSFFMPGNSLGPIGQAGGSKSGLRSALHRRDGSRAQAGPGEELESEQLSNVPFSVSSFTLRELALKILTDLVWIFCSGKAERRET